MLPEQECDSYSINFEIMSSNRRLIKLSYSHNHLKYFDSDICFWNIWYDHAEGFPHISSASLSVVKCDVTVVVLWSYFVVDIQTSFHVHLGSPWQSHQQRPLSNVLRSSNTADLK